MKKRPRVIGVSYESAYLRTIYPQPYDIRMDFVVTERGVHRREPQGLKFLDNPQGFSSPACYAGEIAPGYFGEEPKISINRETAGTPDCDSRPRTDTRAR